jgi:hypothetical protein
MKTLHGVALAAALSGAAAPHFAGEPVPAASEPPPSARTFAALDTNRDGVLSFAEAFADPRVSNNFNALDTNADGVIQPAEYQAIFR